MKPDTEMTFGEHLEELRRRIILALVGIAVGGILCGINYRHLLEALMRPYAQAYAAAIRDKAKSEAKSPEAARPQEKSDGPGAQGEATTAARSPDDMPIEELLAKYRDRFPPPRVLLGGPFTGYVTVIMVSVICGIIVASPWVIYQAWAFVGVGLYPRERRYAYIFGPVSFALFLAGTSTFYFYMLPLALQALMLPTMDVRVYGISVIDPSLLLKEYFHFVAWMTLVFGLVFQTPLVVLFLARTGIVPLGTLWRQQRVIIVLLLFLSAIFTPPDPVTMVVMAIPLVSLYWLGLLAAWILERGQPRTGRARD